MPLLTGDAWQMREMQRQRLLEGLMCETWDFVNQGSEVTEEEFFTRLAMEVCRWLSNPVGLREQYTAEEEFLHVPILSQLNEFSRSYEERDALLAKFLEKHVLPAALSRYYSELQGQEFENPQLIFGAEHAMDEVTVDD